MESSAPSLKRVVSTPLGEKISRASRRISARTQWRLLIASLVLIDIIMLATAFRLAYYLRFELGISFFRLSFEPSISHYQRIILVLIPFWVVIFAVGDLYDRKNLLGGTREYSLVFNATTIGMFAVIAAGFLQPDFIIARGWLILAWALAFFFTALGRFMLRRLVYQLRLRGYFLSTALIVGANDEGLSLAHQLVEWKTSGLHVLGFVDKKFSVGTKLVDNLQVLGKLEDLEWIVYQFKVEELILASSAISSRDKLVDIFKQYGVSNDVNIRISSGLYEIITTGLSVKEFAYVPLVGVNKVRLTGLDTLLKFGLDYCLTIPGLIFLLPFLGLIALAIKLDSPGPIIHRRRVMGVNGRQFDAFKFRTMYVNGDQILEAHPELKAELAENHKLKDDPRVTPVGKILRKTSLDELPQLFNVLRREMSLVGPRMIAPLEIAEYDRWDINLLTVRPGITGLWQVSGRSDISYDQRVRLDMHYIRNWSIWLDIQLLFQTIPAVLRRRGAY